MHCQHPKPHRPHSWFQSKEQNCTKNLDHHAHLCQPLTPSICQGETYLPWWKHCQLPSRRDGNPSTYKFRKKIGTHHNFQNHHCQSFSRRQVSKKLYSQVCIRSMPQYSQKRKLITSLPPSQPYDHPIELYPSFVLKVGKVYSLTLWEQKSTEDFLEENLKSGMIRPSNSPQTSSFFLVNKKDGNDTLRPCQDYWYVNSHTIKDTYPSPLYPTSSTRWKRVFTKFNVHLGYNNVQICDGDQWKATFITHKGLFETTVMFFGLSNSLATFQQFMNESFKDMITEGLISCLYGWLTHLIPQPQPWHWENQVSSLQDERTQIAS